jgi:alpha-aminoadipate carrier protein LysW
MPVCQECESVLDFDPDEVEEGDIVVCDECGTEFEVVATEPLELSQVDAEGYEDEDEEVADEEEELSFGESCCCWYAQQPSH